MALEELQRCVGCVREIQQADSLITRKRAANSINAPDGGLLPSPMEVGDGIELPDGIM
jgi:hypothetical protein